MESKIENRGGKRQGSGRKPGNLSLNETDSLVKAFRRKAKETGMKVGDILAGIAYDLEENTRYRLKALEIYMNITTVKHTHQVVEKIEGPQIMLPQLKPKPMPVGVVRDDEVEHRVH
jgi:hypothetical protein